MQARQKIAGLILATGLAAAPAVAIGVEIVRHASPPLAVLHWFEHLFAPGYNEFLLMLISAAPLALLGVFAYSHLKGGDSRGRMAGILGAWIAGGGLLYYGLIAIRVSHSSTAAIGYLFLPLEVVWFLAIGYFFGRLIGKFVIC